MTTSLRSEVAQLISSALDAAISSGTLPEVDVQDLSIERPQKAENGDFSCSLAMKLARPMRMNPRAIGQAIVDSLPNSPLVGSAWLAGPGFVNFSFNEEWLRSQVDVVIESGSSYGDSASTRDVKVQVEFVSVNPTGPVHVGHARGAVLGSALANVLAAAGYDVQREYYVNDAGRQMELFYETAYVRYLQAWDRDAVMPEEGYQGEYMVDLAQQIRSDHDDEYLGMSRDGAIAAIGEVGLEAMVASIRESLQRIGVSYDNWFRERDLYTRGDYERVMDLIGQRGYRTSADGAEWFAATKLGQEKDAVLIRSNGDPTYFASDVAYHYDKFVGRKFDRVINIWGADHQGHVTRMKAAVSAMDVDPDRLTLMIYQMVTFKQGEELVRLSKRSGDIITVDDLVDQVGADACRFFFLSRAAETQMEFDLELATRQSSDNPVYYVQYAHARIAGIIANAQERGIDLDGGDLSLLTDDAELDLIRKIVQLPELVELMANSLAVHHLPHFAQELATVFHWFYQQCRVISTVEGEEELTRARLRLCQAARVALAKCLDLMGVTAPDKM
ncbi:MAG: arginine--tRNA ligase [Dehalococcoidia bacterium]|nr:arginine--tRNA ligase [Dehalococcoidia bacterium]